MVVNGKRKKNPQKRRRKTKANPAVVTLKRRRLVSHTPSGPAIKNSEFVKMRNVQRIGSSNGDTGGTTKLVDLWDARTGGGVFSNEPFGWAKMVSRYENYIVQAVKCKVIWKPSVAFDTTGLIPQDQILLSRFDGGEVEYRTNDIISTYGNRNNKILHSDLFYWDTALTGTSGQSAWSSKGNKQVFKAYRKPIYDIDAGSIAAVKDEPTSTIGVPFTSGTQRWFWHLEFLPANLSILATNHYVAYIIVDYYCVFLNPRLDA